MKSSNLKVIALACLLAAPAVSAQQASAPAGSTGQCKDGSYTSTATKHGACKGHKGVKEWYAAVAASTAKAAAPAPPVAAVAPAAAPATNTATTSHRPMPAPAANAAPGVGPGMVWVNDTSKVYHCSGDKWYGKTKHGKYMSEAAAKAKGDHPEHGKACSA